MVLSPKLALEIATNYCNRQDLFETEYFFHKRNVITLKATSDIQKLKTELRSIGAIVSNNP
jgi:hypothetical protein